MNERIKELAEQALPNIKYWNDELTKGIGAPKNRAVTVDELEKFAKLIVRECSDLFEIEWGEEKLTGNDVGYVLKKHFGVGE